MKAGLVGKTDKSGQTMVELLVAVAVLMVTISSIVVVSFGNQSSIIGAQNHQLALHLAKNSLEEVKAVARDDFAAVESSSSSEDIFLKETLISALSPYKKMAISRVSWQTEELRPQSIEIATIVANPSEIINQGGDTGGGGLSGDWRNPRTLGAIDLGPGNSATGLDVINKIVYMSAEAAAQDKDDFFIIDATNGENPVVVSSLQTGPSLNDVDAAGSYAYVANSDEEAQLQIIDVSNINSPVLAASFRLPGVSGNGAVGNTLYFYSSKIYIGTQSATGPEFHIVDVSSPTTPQHLGSYEIGGDVNAIHVVENTAYISTSLNNKEVIALDISDPSLISEIGSYDENLNSDGKALYIVGNRLYHGRLKGSDEFTILNIEAPSSIQSLGVKDIGQNINGIVARENLAFLGTSDPNKEFQVFDVSDPANINLWSTFNFPQVITSIDYEDNIIYAAVRSNDALRIITSQ